MEPRLEKLAFRSLLGIYCATIVTEDKSDKTEYWYKNSYRLYKKTVGLKKEVVSKPEGKLLRRVLQKIQDLEEEYFPDNILNTYSLILLTLEYLVYELNDVDFKPILLDIDINKTRITLETDEEYIALNKTTNRYFLKVIQTIRGKI